MLGETFKNIQKSFRPQTFEQ